MTSHNGIHYFGVIREKFHKVLLPDRNELLKHIGVTKRITNPGAINESGFAYARRAAQAAKKDLTKINPARKIAPVLSVNSGLIYKRTG